jgi:hypothetical protein
MSPTHALRVRPCPADSTPPSKKTRDATIPPRRTSTHPLLGFGFSSTLLTFGGIAAGETASGPPPVALMTDAPEADIPAATLESAYTDRFFPGAGHVTLSASSGIPYAGVAEVALGASDGFTVAAVAGIADPDPMVEYAVGGRIEASIFRTRNVGMLFTLPILYYPPSAKRDGGSWILTNPALLVEGSLPWGGLHVYGGIGVLAASCTDDLLEYFNGSSTSSSKDRSPSMEGAWNTFHLGASIPTSRSTSLFFDGMLIMSGLEVSETYSRKIGFPAVAELGWSIRL